MLAAGSISIRDIDASRMPLGFGEWFRGPSYATGLHYAGLMTTVDDQGRTVDQAEDALLDAMRSSDTERLRDLLYEGLSFGLPDGSVTSRAADLDAHASGATRFDSLVEVERSSAEHAGRGRTRSRVDVVVIDGGNRIEVTMIYQRFWSVIDGRWQVVAGSVEPAL